MLSGQRDSQALILRDSGPGGVAPARAVATGLANTALGRVAPTHVNLSVGQASLVLIDSGWFDNRVISAMRD